jgi:hypothetical protein
VLLLGANAFVLMVPLLAILALRLYDNYLLRQTERQLISQSVAIAEIYRELWLQEQGQVTLSDTPSPTPDFRQPGKGDAAFIPIEPVSSLRYGVLPPQPEDLPMAERRDTPEVRAGRRMHAMLRRMQVYNLSAVRILDAAGCVVATTRGEDGLCLTSLPEVQTALAGHYTAVVRERISDEPLPPISEVRSRGSTRVFTALPVFSAGSVVAVVRASRTNLAAKPADRPAQPCAHLALAQPPRPAVWCAFDGTFGRAGELPICGADRRAAAAPDPRCAAYCRGSERSHAAAADTAHLAAHPARDPHPGGRAFRHDLAPAAARRLHR